METDEEEIEDPRPKTDETSRKEDVMTDFEAEEGGLDGKKRKENR